MGHPGVVETGPVLPFLDAERMAHEIGELRERMAKLEGLLEGLREAISGQAAAS